MIHLKAQRRRASFLLASAVLWFVSGMLCSANLLTEVSHEHKPADQEQQAPVGDHHDDNCCQSVQTVTAPTVASHLVKAPITDAIGPVFLFSFSYIFSFETNAALPSIRSTSPPERISFAELVLQRCRQSQAPPLLA